MTERRLDNLGRWAADRQRTGPAPEPRLDALSRALGAPISRRRAFGVVAGAAVAAKMLRPLTARAAATCDDPDLPMKCSQANGNLERFVCAPSGVQCCNTDRCAGACAYTYRDCVNAGSATASCNDTPRMCFDPSAPYVAAKQFKFCSITATDPPQADTCSDPHPRVFGWCCPVGSVCVEEGQTCRCPGELCEGTGVCCPKHHYCDSDGCKTYCDSGDTVRQCGNVCCTSNRHCSGGFFPECECNAPLVACGTGCCDPSTTPQDPGLLDRMFGGWFSTAQQTAGAHGGGHRRSAPAPPEVGATNALLVLATMSAQRGAACNAFADGHHDTKFTSAVGASRTSLPVVGGDAALDAGSAKVLTALTAAQAKSSAQIMAAATALARSRGAIARHNRSAARRQLLASARFADAAVKAPKTEATLRARAAAALKAGGVQEINVPGDAIASLQSSVRSGGMPSALAALLAGVGIKGHDLARVRAWMLQKSIDGAYLGGPVLVEPLSDAAQTRSDRHVITELQAYARHARRHPLVRGH